MVDPDTQPPPHSQINTKSHSVLSLENVSKTYGEFTAVNELSLSIPKGSIYGFLALMVPARPRQFA